MTEHLPTPQRRFRSIRLRQLAPLAVSLMLASITAACTDEDEMSINSHKAPCDVKIQAIGDSTQQQQQNNLQLYMDRAFGRGIVTVENLGVGGSTTADRLDKGWKPADDVITIGVYGINDLASGKVSLEQFTSNLRKLNLRVYETPNFTDAPGLDKYAQAVRDVAAELRRPVADVWEYTKGRPDRASLMTDTSHPGPVLYKDITDKVVGPTLRILVQTHGCNTSSNAAPFGGNAAQGDTNYHGPR